MVHIHHAAVVDIRLHGVPLDPHRQLRSPGHLAGNGNGLIVLVEHRGGISGGGGTGIQGDGAGVLPGLKALRFLLQVLQGPDHGVDRLPARQAQPAVSLQQGLLLVGPDAAVGTVGVPVQIVGVHPQGVKQPQQHLLLGRADAGFIVSHRRPGNSQPACQLRPGDAQLLPALAQLFAKAHAFALLRRGSPHAVDSVPYLLVLVNSFNKNLVNLGLT